MPTGDTVRKFYSALNTGDTSVLDEVLADDWVDIPAPPGVNGPEPENSKPVVAWLCNVFPDFHVQHEEIIWSGDQVAVRSASSGTHSGDFMGVPATGKHDAFRAFDFHVLRDSKIARSWHLEDYGAALDQIKASTGTAGANTESEGGA